MHTAERPPSTILEQVRRVDPALAQAERLAL